MSGRRGKKRREKRRFWKNGGGERRENESGGKREKVVMGGGDMGFWGVAEKMERIKATFFPSFLERERERGVALFSNSAELFW